MAGRSGKAEIKCTPRLLTVPPFLDSQEGARIAESSSYYQRGEIGEKKKKKKNTEKRLGERSPSARFGFSAQLFRAPSRLFSTIQRERW